MQDKIRMDIDIDLHKISCEALGAFPPVGNDNNAASNHAQRMLTKSLSLKRKSGQNITDGTEQALRAKLDGIVNTIEVPLSPSHKVEPESPTQAELQPPRTELLDAIISDCFHTATDGSPAHLKYLQSKARAEIANYLKTTNAGFVERLHFKNYAKKQIRREASMLQNGKP